LSPKNRETYIVVIGFLSYSRNENKNVKLTEKIDIKYFHG
jgi:hypothetical protein